MIKYIISGAQLFPLLLMEINNKFILVTLEKGIKYKMKKYILSYINFLLVLILLSGCGSSNRFMTKSAPKGYNREAMRHMINGTIENLLGQPKNALFEYHQAAEIDSTSSGIYMAIAENYYFLEEFNSSIRLVKKALQRDTRNKDAWELLAANYEKLRLFPEATGAYEQMIKLEPENIMVLYSLTSLQIITRDYAKALQTYQQLVKLGLNDPEYRLRIGHLFLQNRALNQAMTVYLDINKTDPEYEPVYLALAAVSKARNDTSQAVRWYRTALNRNPSFEDVKAELRYILEKRGQLAESIEIFQELVKRDSTNITDKLQLGQYYLQRGDTVQAVLWIEKIITHHPQSERGYLALAAIKKIQKDTLAAEQSYLLALKQNKFFLDARRRLRDIYAAQHKWEEAIALYEPLKNNDTTYVGARIEIVNLLAQKGDTLQAIENCEELEKTNSEDWRVPVTLGRLLMVRNNFHKARLFFNKALSLREDLPLIWILRGVNFMQMDSLDAAEKNFIKASELFPQDPEIAYYLGFVYNRLKKIDQAIEYLEKASKIETNNPQTMLALAALYDDKKEYSRSEVVYELLLKLNPNSPMILNNFAYHLAVRNIHLQQAQEMVEKAIQIDPTNSAYWDTMGWVLFQMGKYDQAKDKVEKSISLSDDSAEVMEHLGEIYEKLGDMENARKHWQKSLEMDKTRGYLKNKLQKYMPQTNQIVPK